MSKLLISTQVHENYGAHDWDGVGQCPQYWKAKGGADYVVKNVDINKATETVQALRGKIESDSEYYREVILDWAIVADDYLTAYEQSQLQYDGKITFGAKDLTWFVE